MSQTNTPSRSLNAFFYFAGQIINIVVSILFAPFLARTLPLHDYGLYGQAVMIGETFAVLASYGFLQHVNFMMQHYAHRQAAAYFNMKWAAVIAGGACMLLWWLLAVILYLQGNTELAVLNWVYSPSVLLQTINYVLVGMLFFQGMMRQTMRVFITTNVLRIVLVFISIYFFSSLNGVFLVLVALRLLECVWFLSLLPASFKRAAAFSPKIVAHSLRTALPLGVASLLQLLPLYVMSFWVSYWWGTEQYALFRAGAMEVFFVSYFSNAVNTSLGPDIAAKIKAEQYAAAIALKKRGYMQAALLAYPIIIWCLFFAKYLIPLYLGTAFQASVFIFIVFNFILFIRLWDFNDILIALHKSSRIMAVYALIVAMVSVAGYFAVQHYALKGAIITVTLANGIALIILLLSVAAHTGIALYFFADIKKLSFLIFIALLLSWVSLQINYQYSENFYMIFLSFFIYISLIYVFLLKIRWLDITMYRQVIEKFPKGKKIYHFLLNI
ncbi:MAG: oligosaccharide flippase family protein [Sphingobacteriales bacterium]|nr:oligosaccharide flippase family protein [Sphingobacteriales bacterium]